MPEAEDVITDAARHATIHVRRLWRRHHDTRREGIALRDVCQRLDLVIAAVFGTSYPIRVAQPPAPPSFLTKVFRRGEGPRLVSAIPATDGASIWLPAQLPTQLSFDDPVLALARYRILALQQAMRAWRGSAHFFAECGSELQRSIYTALEAQAADEAMVKLLPGTMTALKAHRACALLSRPALLQFPAYRRPLEELVRKVLTGDPTHNGNAPNVPAELVHIAQGLAHALQAHCGAHGGGQFLFKDLWTGELRAPPAQSAPSLGAADLHEGPAPSPARSARLSRRPQIRAHIEDEDDRKQGAWMVQSAQPHEQAEDPVGMQRPTDRDESTAAQEFADSLSELPEARLVATPGRPREVLLTDDAPPSRAKRNGQPSSCKESRLQYPEWDCRLGAGAYREPGATVRLLAPDLGPQAWVDQTLAKYRSILDVVRRRFEMLHAQRGRLRKQLEGEELDLEAYIDSYADLRAGFPMSQALYQSCRPAQHDMAIVLLIDISGSTDAWISADKRVIDIEREALLLVCIALQGMAEPYSVLAFSGEGPHGVTVRAIKSFEESYNNQVARRIAALEPEHYTRAGAALRHATALLMGHCVRHRLLLLLSDGKPNDMDDYEGIYGVEDMRQAVTEAKLQGVNLFCLTIDRQAANYLPAVFGAHQYALLPEPELLPAALLDWMKRLVVR